MNLPNSAPIDITALAKDLEELQDFFAQQKQAEQRNGQMPLL